MTSYHVYYTAGALSKLGVLFIDNYSCTAMHCSYECELIPGFELA